MGEFVWASQPYRKVPPRRRKFGWPYEDGDPYAGELTARSWPCGAVDGGWLAGEYHACKDAEIDIEDYIGPPNYSSAWKYVVEGEIRRVESTHRETKLMALSVDRSARPVIRIMHTKGLR